MEPFIGQVIPFCGNYEIRGWAMCNGQLISIAQNTALFSIIGTTYGGDGVQNFALPNLQSRISIHMGQGPGLSPRIEGEASGSETVSLQTSQLPPHNHPVGVGVASAAAAIARANGAVYAGGNQYQTTANADGNLGGVTCGNAGGSLPHNNLQPYVVINYLIALEGIYPPRN